MNKILASKNPKVVAYFAKLSSSQKATLLKLREIILAVDGGITEDIKWKNCLVFMYNGKNLIQTVLGKDKTTLIFFDGSRLDDPQKLLWGEGKTVRSATFRDAKVPIVPFRMLVKKAIEIYKQ